MSDKSPIRADQSRRQFLSTATLLTTATLAGCGYIIHPDRRGQETGGKLDPMVILLDGILTLAFIIPGLIAFTVDVSSGTIYLPSKDRNGQPRLRRVRSRGRKKRQIEEALRNATGIVIPLDAECGLVLFEQVAVSAADLEALRWEHRSAVSTANVVLDVDESGTMTGVHRVG